MEGPQGVDEKRTIPVIKYFSYKKESEVSLACSSLKEKGHLQEEGCPLIEVFKSEVLGKGAFCKVRCVQTEIEMEDGSLGYQYLALKVYNKSAMLRERVSRTEIDRTSSAPEVL